MLEATAMAPVAELPLTPKSAAEARAAGLVPITSADRAAGKVETINGTVSWLAWCRAEARRIRGVGRQAEIVKDEEGKLALWVSPSPHLRKET